MPQANNELINASSREEIDDWVAKYPAEQKQSAVMSALRVVQDQNGGWLTTELMDAVALYLDMDKIQETRDAWQFFRDRRPETYDDMVKLLP